MSTDAKTQYPFLVISRESLELAVKHGVVIHKDGQYYWQGFKIVPTDEMKQRLEKTLKLAERDAEFTKRAAGV